MEELYQRYRAANRLHDSLLSHQNLAESRLSNLRSEHAELTAAWDETQLVSTNADTPEQQSPSEREARYLDQKLFKAEMKYSQFVRLSEKAALTINEMRSGVMHIASLIEANERILAKLPGNAAPPAFHSEEDITKVLSWCEERVIAINEALVLDSTKPTTTDDTQPLHSRQAELASLVIDLLQKGDQAQTPGDQTKRKKARRKIPGGMAQSLIQHPDVPSMLVGAPTSVRVRLLSD